MTDEHLCRHIFWRGGRLVARCVCGHESAARPSLSEARRDAYRHWRGLPPMPEVSPVTPALNEERG